MAIRKRKPAAKAEKHPFIQKLEAVAGINFWPAAEMDFQRTLTYVRMVLRRPRQSLTKQFWKQLQADCDRCMKSINVLVQARKRDEALALARRNGERATGRDDLSVMEAIGRVRTGESRKNEYVPVPITSLVRETYDHLQLMFDFAKVGSERFQSKRGRPAESDARWLAEELYGLFKVCGGRSFVYYDDAQGMYRGDFLEMVIVVAKFLKMPYSSKDSLGEAIKRSLSAAKRRQLEAERGYLLDRKGAGGENADDDLI